MARGDEIERLALQGQALLHHVDLGIGLAQAVPGGGDLRGQQQADILQVGRGLLLAGGGIGDVAAHAAEQVGFVADIRAHHEVVLHGRHGGAAVRRQRTVGGGAQARAAGRGRHLRQQAGAGHARQRLRLFQVGHRHLQRLVLVQRLLHQPVELRIVEALPPWALGRVVGGLRGAPGGLGLPVGGHVHGRARVGRGERASGQQRDQRCGQRGAAQRGRVHDACGAEAAGAEAGVTVTASPCSIESAGLRISASPACRPERISTVRP